MDDTICNSEDGQPRVSVVIRNEGLSPGTAVKGTTSAGGVEISNPSGIGGIGAWKSVSA